LATTLVYEQGLSVNVRSSSNFAHARADLRVEAGVVSGLGLYYSRSYD
jgi:hypothetical protein